MAVVIHGTRVNNTDIIISDLKENVIVVGSTRIPSIQNMVDSFLGKNLIDQLIQMK